MRGILERPRAAAVAGALMVVPLVAANAIVGGRVEPFFSFIRPGPHTSALEYALLCAVLLMLPAGAWIAVRPVFAGRMDGVQRIHALNGAVAALLLVAFVVISAGLGYEIYRCDVLRIPNCD